MSAYNLHPTFTDVAGYRAWRRTWKGIHDDLVDRRARLEAFVATLSEDDPSIVEQRLRLDDMRIMKDKTLGLFDSAQQRMTRIRNMHTQLSDQNALFPLTLENCPVVDFHFNKGSIEFNFLPAWVLKIKGKSYYLPHVDFDAQGTTRETPDNPSTKGSMRFRRVDVLIDADGGSLIRRAGTMPNSLQSQVEAA